MIDPAPILKSAYGWQQMILTPGCALPPNGINISSDNPYTMIASAELEQLRAENARLVAAEKVAQDLLHELDRLLQRIAELEAQG